MLLSLSACQQQDPADESPFESKDPVDAQKPPELVVTDEMAQAEFEAQHAMRMSEEELGIFWRERTGQDFPLTGEWVEKDGSRICDGYMTRVENEDYCESDVPEDWIPFEFEGQTYYVQPLADGSEH
jgi:hypothetical protein